MSYPPYQPPPPAKQRRSVNTIVLLIVGFFGTLFIGMGIGFAAAKSSDTTLVADPAPVVTKTERVSTLITVGPTPPATTAPAPAPVVIHAGTPWWEFALYVLAGVGVTLAVVLLVRRRRVRVVPAAPVERRVVRRRPVAAIEAAPVKAQDFMDGKVDAR